MSPLLIDTRIIMLSSKYLHKHCIARITFNHGSMVMKLAASNLMHPYLCRMSLNPFSRFFYYTAGSGGAGPTILTTSFLLLGEDVIAYNKGTSYFFVCLFMVFLGEILSVLLIQEKKSNWSPTVEFSTLILERGSEKKMFTYCKYTLGHIFPFYIL